MIWLKYLLVSIIGYLLGSISPSYYIGLKKGIDIRTKGSGNLGTTNSFRVLGKNAGIVTLIADVLKGIIAVLIGRAICGITGGYLAGFFAIVGHDYPFYLDFKGGKGVATSLGVMLILEPKIAIIAIILGLIVILSTGMVSAGALTGFTVYPILYLFLEYNYIWYKILIIFTVCILGIIRHRANIKRIINKTEGTIWKGLK
ncbi:MAG: glycerol-3-phosphate 1-O-acyltransferase PlsY [Tissierellia bacterium]|nr:glycerol-3-phosphate 1-O-acyltransferase PlsY [Tissierellia bacterium]